MGVGGTVSTAGWPSRFGQQNGEPAGSPRVGHGGQPLLVRKLLPRYGSVATREDSNIEKDGKEMAMSSAVLERTSIVDVRGTFVIARRLLDMVDGVSGLLIAVDHRQYGRHIGIQHP